MKAVIMAGGGGTRLRPITCKTPKPMAQVAGKPAMRHIIGLLKKNGVDEAAVTTMYLAHKVESMGEEVCGVKLTYYREDTPLGTAGSVRRAAADFDEDFIVISGDCICDFDLKSAFEYHKTKNSVCTAILTRRSDPLEYGVALCDADGRITEFIEKPAWSQVFSDYVNTGIYIIRPDVMKMIPPDTAYDFAKDLFPRILDMGMYGYEAQGYWCDVGSVRDYYHCNFDAAQGKVGSIGKIPLQNGSIIGSECIIHGKVRDSILHSGVTVGENSRLDSCIVCADAVIGKNVTVKSGAVIGEGCVVGDGSVIESGVKIYADIKIPKGSVVMQDILRKGENELLFGDNGISGNIKGSLSPERCFMLGAACVIREGARVGVMLGENGGAVGALVKNCILNGISHAGGVPLDFGEGEKVLSAHAALCYRQDIMLYVRCEGDSVSLFLLGGDSLTLCSETERKIRSGLEGGIKSGRSAHKPIKISGIKELYISNLVRGRSDMTGLVCSVSESPEGILLAQALTVMGADVTVGENSGKGVHFDIDDEQLSLHTPDFSADFEHVRALLVHHKAPAYKNIALPYASPEILTRIAHERGARVFRYLTTPTGGGDKAARSIAADFSQLIFRDVCFMATQICEMLTEAQLSLEKFMAFFEELPHFSCETRDIDYEEEKRAQLMRRITRHPSRESEGAQIIFTGGRALVIPKRTGGFRIIAEAVSSESAREISFMTERELYGKEEQNDIFS